MQSDKLESAVRWLLGAILLFTPLVFYTHNPYPFATPKVIFFQTLVEISFVLWLSFALYNPSWRPRVTPLGITLFLFVATLFLTGLLGIDPQRSLWGIVDEKDGGVLFLHLFLFFVVLSSTPQLPVKKYVSYLLVAGVILSVFAILQFNSAVSFQLGGVTQRPGGLTSNAPFLAGYLISLFFLSLWSFFVNKYSEYKIYYVICALIYVITIFITQTRGAIVALVIGIIILLISALLKNGGADPRKKMAIVGAIVLLLIGSGAVLETRGLHTWDSVPGISRLVSHSAYDAAHYRITFLVTAIDGWKVRPFFGFGLGNFDSVFQKFYNPLRFPKIYSTLDGTAHPHNTPVGYLVETGVVGLFSYLLIFAAFFYQLWHAKIPKSFFFVGLVVAYFVQGLFVFDRLITVLPVIFLLAIVNIEYGNHKFQIAPQKSVPVPYIQLMIVGALLLLIAPVIYYTNINTFLAESAQYDAEFLTNERNNARASIKLWEAAINIKNPYHKNIQLALIHDATSSHKRGLTSSSSPNLVTLAIEIIESADHPLPNNATYMFERLDLYNTLSVENREFVEKATYIENTLLQLAPYSYKLFLEKARTALLIGNRDEAIKNIEYAISLNSRLEDPQLILARTLAEIGDTNSSSVEINIALAGEKFPKYANTCAVLGDVESSKGNYNNAISLYSCALEFPPIGENNRFDELLVNAKLNLGLNYFLAGDEKSAKKVLSSLRDELGQRKESISYRTYVQLMRQLGLSLDD